MVNVLKSPKWTALYRARRNGSFEEVVVNSTDKPEEKKVMRFPGIGRLTYHAVSITPLKQPEGGFKEMATKTKKKKADEDELEGLEGLDEDLEDVEEDEPEDEEEVELDEDDEDEEEEKPKSKKSKKSKKKGTAPPRRELPKGKHGPDKIAELAGKDARAVRIFLRKKGIKKKEGRYEFSLADCKKIAKAMKK